MFDGVITTIQPPRLAHAIDDVRSHITFIDSLNSTVLDSSGFDAVSIWDGETIISRSDSTSA